MAPAAAGTAGGTQEVDAGGAGGAAPAVSLPRGGGAIRGMGEKFRANPVTGTASMTVPIAVAPGRSDFGPELSLSYDSGAGNGPFGFGWSLSLPRIERKTDKGLPEYRDAAESDVFLLSGSEDLVPVLRRDAEGELVLDDDGRPEIHEDVLDGHDVRRYRPRIESLFARVERWTRKSDGDIHWRTITRDNVTTLYGKDGESRIWDPGDPAAGRPPRTFSWLVCESYDDKGNAMLFGYEPELRNRYLKRIKYGNRLSRLHPAPPADWRDEWLFEVVFEYEPRPDPFSSYRAGFEVRTRRRCRSVSMFHDIPELDDEPYLVRSTDLDYADLDYSQSPTVDEELAHQGSTRFASFVRAITQAGFVRDGDDYLRRELPPLEFEYSRPLIDDELHEADPSGLDGLPVGLDGRRYRWVDLDGEGISGVLSEHAGAWRYKPNLGGGRFGDAELVASTPSLGSAGTPSRQLVDLDGDGRLDLMVLTGSGAGFYERSDERDWEPFQPFAQRLEIAWDQANLRLVDLTGDGLADVLITEEGAFTCYPSLGEEGFGASRPVRTSPDEDQGPRLVFGDRTESVYLADMSGDGLTDLVRIRNGEVCYWPSLGYGRFGAKVGMADAPWFDHPDRFDHARIRLVDADGSGVTDIVYLGDDAARLYLNRAGNSWTAARELPHFPRTDRSTSVTALDLLGTGTGCLVWSSPLPGSEGRTVRYIDLMAGGKPHLLVRASNNLGAETHVRYAPSTRFYLKDKREGTPWATRLPFPVQVVERVETLDRVSGNRFVARYAYHHGHFDGREREFRGFGLVDQWDTEELAALTDQGELPAATNEEPASHVPPVWTRTWFHTGAADAPLSEGLSAEERDEARRALKGTLLRRAVYGLDGSIEAAHPYSVTEESHAPQLLQPRAGKRHAVFLPHVRETLTFQYERQPANPRVAHRAVLEVDRFGNERRVAEIAYPRPVPDGSLASRDQAVQDSVLVTYTEQDVTNTVDRPHDHRPPLPSEVRTYELDGVTLPSGAARLELDEVDAATTDAAVEKRMIERVRTIYRADDLSGALALGTLQPRALLHATHALAFTPALLAEVYDGRVDDAILAAAGYVHSEGDESWWVPSGRVLYSPGAADTPQQELAHALEHFFVGRRYRDPLNPAPAHDARVTYDAHDLLLLETRDAAGNRITVGEHDYRVLEPAQLIDPNRNVSLVAFDALGMVVATALTGDPLAAPAEGDLLHGFDVDLTEAQIVAHLADPAATAATLLGDATTRVVYDVLAYHRTRDDASPRPAVASTMARETHVSDLAAGQQTRIQQKLVYSDGFGREIQTKARAARPGGVLGWSVSGWTVFNNKGKPVRTFEPFFSATHAFEADFRAGVAAISHYDPLERVVAVLHPDHSWEKVLFDAWRVEMWDVNDTVLVEEEDLKADRDVRDWFRRLPDDDYLPTWHAQRAAGALGPEQQVAARKTAVHAGTPAVAHLDPLERPFLTVLHNAFLPSGAAPGDPRTEEHHATRTLYDIEGEVVEVTDPLDRVVARHIYDLLGRRVRETTMEAGERWTLPNIAGQAAYVWHSRGLRLHTRYDALRRPIETRLRVGTGPERLVEKAEWGETAPAPEASNLRGKPFRHFDQAGEATSHEYDFKGNPTHSSRRFADDYEATLDWSGAVALQADSYVSRTRYNALNNPSQLTTPDGSVVRPAFNVTGLLESLEVSVRGAAAEEYVERIEYDASGRRTLLELDNGAKSEYGYDPLTRRLTSLLTTRGSGPSAERVQALSYVYDPSGNPTHVDDTAQQTVFFRNQRVAPTSDYVYDALYRLIEARGREELGRYREEYRYDAAGNMEQLLHHASDPASAGFTRAFTYAEPSQIDSADTSNRLSSSTIAGVAENFSSGGDGYDEHGNMLRMPHLQAMEWDFRDRLRMSQRQKVNDDDVDGEERHGERTFYVYDSSGQRVRKVTERANGAVKDERLYLGLWELYRRFGTGALVRETLHVRDGERPVASVETRTDVAVPESLVRYRLDDRLGSCSVELDDQAQLIAYEEYAPFGTTSLQTARSQLEAPRRYRFTGRERDEESGLYHHGERLYAPWLARWTSTDPAGVEESRNLYTYVSNRPTVQVDPNGRQGKAPALVAQAAVGANSGSGSGGGGGSGGFGAAIASIGRGIASVGRAIGGFFETISRGLKAVSGFIREWFPGLIAAPLAGLVDILGGLSKTLGGIFAWKGKTVLSGLADMGKGFLSIFGLKEVFTEGFTTPPTRKDALGNVRELPTGMKMPRSLANDLWDARNATQEDAGKNGMHSWHAASNAHLATRLGPVGAVFLWLAGLFHETFDIKSFKGEQYWQGTVNHILDSLTDIIANTFGILLGMIVPRRKAVEWASWLGNYIPGPGEPDPAFGGAGVPYGTPPRANDPRRAWGHYPDLRGPGTTREQLKP